MSIEHSISGELSALTKLASYPGPLGLVHTIRAYVIFPVKAENSYFCPVDMNLDLKYGPKNHLCWQRFGLKKPVMTNLAFVSQQHRQRKNKEAIGRISTHI